MIAKMLLLIVIGGMIIAVNKKPRDTIEELFQWIGYGLMVFSVCIIVLKLMHDFILTKLI